MLSAQLRDVVIVGTTRDWDLSSGTFKFTSGLDGVAQAIDFAVRMHKGEWFMDLLEGVAYFEREGVTVDQAILGSKFNADMRARAEYTRVIAGIEGVLAITNMQATLVGRTLNVSTTVSVTFDDIAVTTLTVTTLVQQAA